MRTRNSSTPAAADADLIGFTVLTPQAPWVYRTADRLRSLGKKVLLGGMHVTALPEEAKPHADALVLGESEHIWKDLLDDAEKEQAQTGLRRRILRSGQPPAGR